MDKYVVNIAGSATDTFYDVDTFPLAGDFTRAKLKKTCVGGNILNNARVIRKLGIPVYEIEYLKENDPSTKIIVDSLNKDSINTELIKYDKSVVNCNCMIMECGREKTIYVVDSKRPIYKVDAKCQKYLNSATFIYSMMNLVQDLFGGYKALKTAKKHGAKIIFDASSQYKDKYEVEMLKIADGVFLNAQSYQRLKTFFKKEPYVELIEKGMEFMCVTDGDKGATCYTKDKIYFKKALKVKVKDSTGAGDAFAGCFIASLIKGYSYKEALNLANINGAYACTVNGGNKVAISFKELKEFYKKVGR